MIISPWRGRERETGHYLSLWRVRQVIIFPWRGRGRETDDYLSLERKRQEVIISPWKGREGETGRSGIQEEEDAPPCL